MIAYVLNKPLDCNKICYDIQNLINYYANQDGDKVLIIDIKTITDTVDQTPLIEYTPIRSVT